jgi:hypothetical protein
MGKNTPERKDYIMDSPWCRWRSELPFAKISLARYFSLP